LPPFVQILPETGSLQRVVVPLVDLHVVTNPLLNKQREECCHQTQDESHEPKRVFENVGGQWYESRVRRWRGGGDRDLGSDGGDLLGNLGEKDRMLLEVIDRLICRVDLQALLAVEYESGEGAGE